MVHLFRMDKFQARSLQPLDLSGSSGNLGRSCMPHIRISSASPEGRWVAQCTTGKKGKLKLQKGKAMANYIYKPNMLSATHEGKTRIGWVSTMKTVDKQSWGREPAKIWIQDAKIGTRREMQQEYRGISANWSPKAGQSAWCTGAKGQERHVPSVVCEAMRALR